MGRFAVLGKKYFDEKFNEQGAGGNPNGGEVDIATVNYLAILQQQFNSYSQGSSSALLLNLPNSVLETINLYATTLLTAGYIAITNAVYDLRYALKTQSGSSLPGIINPAHLRMSNHFNGSGALLTGAIAADAPAYNSSKCNEVEIKSVTGTASVDYYLKGNR